MTILSPPLGVISINLRPTSKFSLWVTRSSLHNADGRKAGHIIGYSDCLRVKVLENSPHKSGDSRGQVPLVSGKSGLGNLPVLHCERSLPCCTEDRSGASRGGESAQTTGAPQASSLSAQVCRPQGTGAGYCPYPHTPRGAPRLLSNEIKSSAAEQCQRGQRGLGKEG